MISPTLVLWVLTLAAFGLFGARLFRYVKVLLAARGETLGPSLAAPETGSRQRAGAAEIVGGADRRGPFPDLLGLRLLCLEFFLEPYPRAVSFSAHPVRGRGLVDARRAGGIRRPRPGRASGGRGPALLLSAAEVGEVEGRLHHSGPDRGGAPVLPGGAVVSNRGPGRLAGHVVGPHGHGPWISGLSARFQAHASLASPFGVFFASLEPGRVPEASPGAARREDFTWRQLFSGLACAECAAGAATGHARRLTASSALRQDADIT